MPPIRALHAACTLACLLPVQYAAAHEATVDLIDGKRLESLTIRRAAPAPVVVFENGSRATLDKWDKVIDALNPQASVFAYNRPGYGRSDSTDSARDGDTIVEQLRGALKQKGLAPPYILVGHSLGGLYMQLFARRHPEEVRGLVLVDALYPRVVKQVGDFPLMTRMAKSLFFSSAVGREIDAIHATGEAVLAAPGIDDKPIVKLINKPTSATAVPVNFGAMDASPETQALVRQLYPNAKKLVVDSDHQMQTANPEIIARAINDMLNATASER